jgi:hypothetical protein
MKVIEVSSTYTHLLIGGFLTSLKGPSCEVKSCWNQDDSEKGQTVKMYLTGM